MDTFSSIDFHFQDVAVPDFDKQAVSEWIRKTIEKEKQETGFLNIVFCNDDYLLELNKSFLQHNTLTDIITFDYTEELEGISGDIFISVPRVRENAEKLQTGFSEELHRVVIHGILHLLGFKDKTPVQKRRMREKENYYLTLRFEEF